MVRAAERMATKALLRLVSITTSKSASSIRRSSPSLVIPALLTSTSSRPWLSATRSIDEARAPESAMSQTTGSAEPASSWLRTSSHTCRSLSALRATATTCRPSLASRRTIAAPIPRDPPVTMATRFSFITPLLRSLLHALHRQPPVNPPRQSSQCTARGQLDEPARWGFGHQRLHRLFPAHRLDDLLNELLLDR